MIHSGAGGWHAYFWPGTTILRNKLGITDHAELHLREFDAAETRALQIRDGSHHIDRTLDSDHLRNIHAHLFGDLYDWAGHYRTVNISKTGNSGTTHHFGDHASMDMYMRQLRALINRTSWRHLDRLDVADHLADVHTRLNFAHPFREGNGRTSRIFLAHLAQFAGYDVDFGLVTAHAWNTASAATFLHPHGLRLDSRPLAEIYRDIVVPG